MSAQAIVADDHPLFRSALVQAVATVLQSEILQAANFQEVVSLLEQNDSVELVLLDLNMPGNDGLTGLTSIVNAFPGVSVVVVSAQEDPITIKKAMDFGSSGFIPKSSPISVLSEAVETVLDGEQWLPENISLQLQHVNEPESEQFAEKLKLLTPHQFSVLKLLADGLLNKQIAYELNVQETTIKQHVSAILKKLQVYNRTQAGVIFKQAMGAEGQSESSSE
ncbi:response regulator transcription factor [Paraneptunicella aestuarii]|uniref:response regulator transcription factor n=1 Tax=Paraneptunicella aestuarii TaxID=2831148 RepID=UPI001E3BC2D8|nr:response regulator transcription factor [Paraneptunicella aestuarii]UAA37913.1 response regulator transcription factor [Paraneptunicella aestuarii]